MQLEQLQQQWQSLDHKLNQALMYQAELTRRIVMQPARRRINRSGVWPAIDIVFCVGVLLACVSFLSSHWQDVRLASPTAGLMIGAVALLVNSIVQLQTLSELDWAGPVATIQHSLDKLRILKIRQFKWVILLSPLVGFCGLVVTIQWLFEWLTEDRLNMIDRLDSRWIVANYIVGVLFVPIGYLVIQYLANRCSSRGWWKSALDDIAGKGLKTAENDLKSWASLRQVND